MDKGGTSSGKSVNTRILWRCIENGREGEGDSIDGDMREGDVDNIVGSDCEER